LISRSECGTLVFVNESTQSGLTVERRKAIAELVERQGAASVSDLAERFDVSTATIRRDLETLEKQGTVQRVYGGAVRAEQIAVESALPPQPTGAARIGQAVVDMIEDGDTIFLGPGPLSLEIARCLKERSRITVVTNGLDVAHWLAHNTSHTVIITGGQVGGPNQDLVGKLTRTGLTKLRADRAILELGGVSVTEGLTLDSLPQSEIAQMLLEAGPEIIIVVPAERIGRVGAAYVGPVSAVDVLVTAREAPSPFLWDLSEIGVRIVLA